MTDLEKQGETPRIGDWWCPECKEALPGSRVTFTERCDTCGTPVHVAGEGEVARLERELAQMASDLDDANYWRKRHSEDSAARGVQSHEHWLKWKAAERRVSELEAALRPFVDSDCGKNWNFPDTAKETALSNARAALAAERKEGKHG